MIKTSFARTPAEFSGVLYAGICSNRFSVSVGTLLVAWLMMGALLQGATTSTGTDSRKAPPSEEHPKLSESALKAIVLFAPRPEYPFEARRLMQEGAGEAVIKVDPQTGLVVRAVMYASTGSEVLDQATVNTLRKWRFRSNTIKGAIVPITFSMQVGVSVGHGAGTYSRTSKSMDDVLARYLGKGTILKGPLPEYPGRRPTYFKEGRGVYEIHVDKSGLVQSVRILKGSGDASFDRSVQSTLGKWKLSRGPLVVELPFRFILTPDSYSLELAR